MYSLVHRMWEWCTGRNLNIRDLALQFALQAPVEGNGIVLTGPANPSEIHEAYESAIIEIHESVWRDFHEEFDVSV